MNEYENNIMKNAKIVERMSASYIADACKNCQADYAKIIRVMKKLLVRGALFSEINNTYIIEPENRDVDYFNGVPEFLAECNITAEIDVDGNLVVTRIPVKFINEE